MAAGYYHSQKKPLSFFISVEIDCIFLKITYDSIHEVKGMNMVYG